MAKTEKKKIGLTTRIFISLLLGAILGVFLHYCVLPNDAVQNILVDGVFYVVGQGFLRLMQMLVVPLVLCSLICGASAIGDTKTLGKVGVRTVVFYIITTALAVAVALIVARIINPGVGMDLNTLEVAETQIATTQTSMVDTLLDIIPKNPIESLATGNMLQIIVFAIIVGIILAKLGDKTQIVHNLFQQGTIL